MSGIRILLALIAMAGVHAHATRYYVRAAATGTNNGTSWANAYTDLQSALGIVVSGDTVWTANGTYKPTTTTTRTISFVIPSGVAVFGGFSGTETSLSQRDTLSFQTILSGAIGSAGLSDNSYQVVSIGTASSLTRLDGFKIMYGYASTSTGYNDRGGGISSGGSPTIANCYVLENYAYYGGGMHHGGSGTLQVQHCRFSDNTAQVDGGAIYVVSSTAKFIACDIFENDAAGDGGAFYSDGAKITINRCAVSGNRAGVDEFDLGGVVYEFDNTSEFYAYNSLLAGNQAYNNPIQYSGIGLPGSHAFVNCTIVHNKITGTPTNPFLLDISATDPFTNCIVWGNSTADLSNFDGVVSHCLIQGGYASGTGIISADPKFVNPATLSDAPFNAAGYDYRLKPLSPAVDTGLASALPATYSTLDLDDSTRTFGAKIDLGSYELHYCPLAVSISPVTTQVCPGTTITLTASGGSSYLWKTGATTSAITAGPGTYQVKAADGNGCLGKASRTLTAYPGSIAISGDNHLCADSTNVLTAGGSNISAYSWNTGAGTATLSVTAAGTYIVTGTTPENCTLKDTLVVFNAPTPNPVITSGSGGVLQTSSFSAYQWYLNGSPIAGANNQTYLPVANGSYTVTVHSIYGCPGTSATKTVTGLSVENPVSENKLQVFPNPASSQLNMELPAGLTASAALTMTDVYGRIVWTQQSIAPGSSKRISINTGAFPPGVYLLKLTDVGQQRTTRVSLVR